jgi:hypothetical protein
MAGPVVVKKRDRVFAEQRFQSPLTGRRAIDARDEFPRANQFSRKRSAC